VSFNFSIQNGSKQGGALSPLLFNFALDYALRKVCENQVCSKLNGTRQLLAYGDEVNLLGDNIENIKRNTTTFTDAIKEVGLEENIEKSKYMFMFHHQNSGQNCDMMIANLSFENPAQVNTWEQQQQQQVNSVAFSTQTNYTNKNVMQKGIKR
jgi:hypothetical protein